MASASGASRMDTAQATCSGVVKRPMDDSASISASTASTVMPRCAALSAADPIVEGQRAKPLPEERQNATQALAHEYQLAITRYLQDTPMARLAWSTYTTGPW